LQLVLGASDKRACLLAGLHVA